MSTSACIDVSATKWRPGCEQFVDRSAFWKNKSTRDGLQSYCKTCLIGMQRKETSEQRAERLRAAEERQRRAAAAAELRDRERQRKARDRELARERLAAYRTQTETTRAARILEQQRQADELRLKREAAAATEDQTPIPSDAVERDRSRCECGKLRKVKCGFPNQGGICGEPLCDACRHEIRPKLNYCDPHYERAMYAKARAQR